MYEGRVSEIIFAKDLLCILFDTGKAIAYDLQTGIVKCELNEAIDSENCTIRSLSYNKRNDTLIVAWNNSCNSKGLGVFVADRYDIAVHGLLRFSSKARRFENFHILYPGFLEFEDFNGRLVTSTSENHLFTFWDMESYEPVFSESNEDYIEMRISRGTVALFENLHEYRLGVRLCRLKDGMRIVDTCVNLLPGHDLTFLELCGCFLLTKQEGANLRVHNLLSGEENRVTNTVTLHPKSVFFFPTEAVDYIPEPSLEPLRFICTSNQGTSMFTSYGGQLIKSFDFENVPQTLNAEFTHILSDEQIMMVLLDGAFDLMSTDVNFVRANSVKKPDENVTPCPSSLDEGCPPSESAPKRFRLRKPSSLSLYDLASGKNVLSKALELPGSILKFASDGNTLCLATLEGVYVMRPGFEVECLPSSGRKSRIAARKCSFKNRGQTLCKVTKLTEAIARRLTLTLTLTP
ncbi:MAG: uncharacterized protein KVP18_001595 [Porospora cf. gigantea A]|uniref:uncharacterized protein n=1 Tax=Porospora cf. gigantea A TaxID=2853593 RepID=UPI003559629C|nr:MAG: hypothetical protein KVP18_001595 [Porospora cf. gigantea A]